MRVEYLEGANKGEEKKLPMANVTLEPEQPLAEAAGKRGAPDPAGGAAKKQRAERAAALFGDLSDVS